MANSAPAVANAIEQKSSMASSPSMQAQKRRHTSAFEPEALSSSGNKAKRLKTYGAKGYSPVREDDTKFGQLRDDSRDQPRTSQSARFTEHSGFHSSAELPPFAQARFMDHEPIVLFKDSGSTVEDTASAQQALIEQNLGWKSDALGLQSDVERSSSFPWSASEQTRSAKSTANPQGRAVGRARGDEDAHPDLDGDRDADDGDGCVGDADKAETVSKEPSIDFHPEGHPSPTVVISQKETMTATGPTSASEGTQKSSRARKKKEEAQTTDPLNSDDKAIGLPKERYVPRPSRRRATAATEEPVDYSVRPEKAAKTKRTKTATAETTVTTIGLERNDNLPSGTRADGTDEEQMRAQSKSTSSHDKDKSGNDVRPTSSDTKNHNTQNDQSSKSQDEQSPRPESKPSSSEQKSDDKIFVKPALPTPRPKSTSKSKRSHTTIFEDHVEFVGSQRSPSLNQQQAKRKSALQDVQNESTQSSKRKRKNVLLDDDDDEDELAKDPEEDETKEASLPKKRGRGRPPKSTAKPETKSAETVLDDSGDEGDDTAEVDEVPKKRRGRPAKAAVESQLKPDEDTVPSKADEAGDSTANPVNPSTENAEAPQKSTKATQSLRKGGAGATADPTPSPQKDGATSGATPTKPTKPSPTTHSPIKKWAKAPFRVGLSKTHRIPSLLRTMNPRKK